LHLTHRILNQHRMQATIKGVGICTGFNQSHNKLLLMQIVSTVLSPYVIVLKLICLLQNVE